MDLGVRAVELRLDGDVQIPLVPLIGRAGELDLQLLPLVDDDPLPQVEHGLLPMRALVPRTGAETDGLVTGAETNVKVGDKGVNVVVARRFHGEFGGEGEILGLARVQIKGKKKRR